MPQKDRAHESTRWTFISYIDSNTPTSHAEQDNIGSTGLHKVGELNRLCKKKECIRSCMFHLESGTLTKTIVVLFEPALINNGLWAPVHQTVWFTLSQCWLQTKPKAVLVWNNQDNLYCLTWWEVWSGPSPMLQPQTSNCTAFKLRNLQ